jgi:uncharacterized membrane protein YraQ (UPF0718 family)
MAQQQLVKEERSIGDLFSELADETGTLIRQEIALARAELMQKAMRLGKNAGYLVAGGALGYIALQALVTALIVGLAYVIPLWLAALLVGIVIGIAAGVIVYTAYQNLKNMEVTPQETVETLKEDVQWLKKQV